MKIVNIIFRHKLLSFILFLLLAGTGPVFSQQSKRMNNWLFGQNAWLTWNELRTISNIPRADIGHTGAPAITLNDLPQSLEGNKMDQQEGVSCLSNENGELMFYSDGINIWNKNHEYMQKTDGTTGYGQKVLPGNPSSSQSGVAIPYPGNPDKYILLGMEHNEYKGFGYVVVDMTKNNGLGGIEPVPGAQPSTKKYISLASINGSIPGESLTALRHANGRDIWVVTIGKGTGNAYFQSWLFTDKGILKADLVSYAGYGTNDQVSATTFVDMGFGFTSSGINGANGYFRFSSDYKYFAIGLWNGGTTKGNEIIPFGEFDNTTGLPVPGTTKLLSLQNTFALTSAYGIEFSSQSKYLYASSPSRGVLALDFQSLLNAPIVNNVVNIANVTHRKLVYSTDRSTASSAIQLAVDGRMYICKSDASSAAETCGMYLIPDPEPATLDDIAVYSLATNVLFKQGIRNKMGLPNFIQGWLNADVEALPQYCITFETPLSVILKNLDEVPNLDRIVWAYGDGEEKTFTRANVDGDNKLTSFHTYLTAGEYTQTIMFCDIDNAEVGQKLIFKVEAKQCYVRANMNTRSHLDNAKVLKNSLSKNRTSSTSKSGVNLKYVYIKNLKEHN